jgi:hypothetical protein
MAGIVRCLQDSGQPSVECWPVLSLQLTSDASSSQCAPVGPGSAWWNDKRNDIGAFRCVANLVGTTDNNARPGTRMPDSDERPATMPRREEDTGRRTICRTGRASSGWPSASLAIWPPRRRSPGTITCPAASARSTGRSTFPSDGLTPVDSTSPSSRPRNGVPELT